VLLVCRFAPDDVDAFVARARRALALLVEQPGCRDAQLGRATDDPGRWVLVASFDSVTAYRRALQPFEVREHVVPWLSEALADEPAAYERRLEAGPDQGVVEHESLLSPDGPRDR
jgi:quinol monooxygenase YgiN